MLILQKSRANAARGAGLPPPQKLSVEPVTDRQSKARMLLSVKAGQVVPLSINVASEQMVSRCPKSMPRWEPRWEGLPEQGEGVWAQPMYLVIQEETQSDKKSLSGDS